MSDLLWSNERIRDNVQKVAMVMGTRQVEPFVLVSDAEKLLRQVRDDLDIQLHNAYLAGIAAGRAKERARIAELEAQLAQTWQPLPDGSYDIHLSNGNINEFRVNDDSITVIAFDYYGNAMDSGWVSIGDIRLCRLVERAEVQPTEVDHE